MKTCVRCKGVLVGDFPPHVTVELTDGRELTLCTSCAGVTLAQALEPLSDDEAEDFLRREF